MREGAFSDHSLLHFILMRKMCHEHIVLEERQQERMMIRTATAKGISCTFQGNHGPWN